VRTGLLQIGKEIQKLDEDDHLMKNTHGGGGITAGGLASSMTGTGTVPALIIGSKRYHI